MNDTYGGRRHWAEGCLENRRSTLVGVSVRGFLEKTGVCVRELSGEELL